MERGTWEICRSHPPPTATALIPFCSTTWYKTLYLRRRYIAQRNDNGTQSTYHLFRRHIKSQNTTSNKYYIVYSTGSNIKLDWNAQVVHALFMCSPVIHCLETSADKPCLLAYIDSSLIARSVRCNWCRYHCLFASKLVITLRPLWLKDELPESLTAQVFDSYPPSLPDRSLPTDADSFVFLRPNLLSFFTHSDWMMICCPVLKTTFSAQYPFSYTFVKVAYMPSTESLSDNRHCRSKYLSHLLHSESINMPATPRRKSTAAQSPPV